MFQQLACQQILLECHEVGIGIEFYKRINERTASGRGFKQHPRLYAVATQYLRHYIGNFLRSIERREYGRFQRVHIAFVLRIVLAVLTDEFMKFNGRCKQIEVRLRPMDGIRQVLGRIQNTFQPSETAIFLQYRTLFGCRCTLLPVKGEYRPYCLDVVPQLCLAVKRHTLRCRGLRLLSVPNRAGHIRVIGRRNHLSGRRWKTHCL